MRRTLTALMFVVGLLASACSSAAAPTPQIVYVTQPPATPIIIYVTPAPTPTARPTASPDMRWQRDPWVPPTTPVCPDPNGWFTYGSDQTHWVCVAGGPGGTTELLPPITNTYLEAMIAAAYPVTSKLVCDRDFPHLNWYAYNSSTGSFLLTVDHPGECRDHQ